jgi:hypothetical protein
MKAPGNYFVRGVKKIRKTKMEMVFPMILIVIDLCASAVYAMQADWRRTVYWFAAAVLTLCVTI